MRPVAIYTVTNILNDKMYIGQSVNPQKRRHQHNWPKSGCTALRSAVQKHGKENFEFKILCWCPDKAYADMVETKLIEAHDTRRVGYNICVGGEGFGSGEDHPTYGTTLSEEHKGKVAAALKGKKKAPEHAAKVAATWVGKKHTAEARANMSAAHMGHTHTEATRAKMSATRKNRPLGKRGAMSEKHKCKISEALIGIKRSLETRAKIGAAKEINHAVVIRRGGDEFIFNNPTDCAEYLGASRANVMRYLRGERVRRDGWVVAWVDKNGD